MDTSRQFKSRLAKQFAGLGLSKYPVAASVDGWTESETLTQFDGFSVHFIDEDFKIWCWKLPLLQVTASHTCAHPLSPETFESLLLAENIRAAFDSAMTEMGLSPAFVTADTAANIQGAFPEEGGIACAPSSSSSLISSAVKCFDHVLNLAIKDAFADAQVAAAFSQVTGFINMMNQSPLRLRAFEECWRTLHPNGEALPSLITFCPTRWIGIYETLKRFLSLRPAIVLFLARHVVDLDLAGKFPDFERDRWWECMEEIRLALFPLAVAMQALQAEAYPTLAWSTVLFHALKGYLESARVRDLNYEAFKAFRKVLQRSLKERVNVGFWTDAHLLATRLHPAIRHVNSLGWSLDESAHLRQRADTVLEHEFRKARILSLPPSSSSSSSSSGFFFISRKSRGWRMSWRPTTAKSRLCWKRLPEP